MRTRRVCRGAGDIRESLGPTLLLWEPRARGGERVLLVEGTGNRCLIASCLTTSWRLICRVSAFGFFFPWAESAKGFTTDDFFFRSFSFNRFFPLFPSPPPSFSLSFPHLDSAWGGKYLQMNTDDDKFPILVRRDSYPGIVSRRESHPLSLPSSFPPCVDPH